MTNESEGPEDALWSLELGNRIDQICDEFERQWRSGNRPELSDFLNRISPDEQAALFPELLQLDWDFRVQLGEQGLRDCYLGEFAEFTEQIDQVEARREIKETITNSDQPTLEDPPQQGKVIGHFRLEERLGYGAAGEVWKAIDLKLKRIVAIKFPRSPQLTENQLHRFEREGKAAAQLQHVGIVSVHEVGRQGDYVYIVSDYIEGQDLRRWLATKRPTPREAAALCAQLAQALDHAHDRGVIHRDLKPANIVMDEAGGLHITDFGLAKWSADESDMTLEGDLLGTPAYMSPEQARGEAANTDPRTDIYSLGVLLYEMLTGTCPFIGDHTSILNQVIHESPKSPRELDTSIPRDLETICLKTLEKRPRDRYPSAQEMTVDLRRFLRGDPILTRRPNLVERITRWMRKRPSMVASSVFGVIALFAVGAVFNYAQENRALLGFRSVSLLTEPSGAEVVFVPVNDNSGEPEPDKMVKPSDRTPLRVDLKPGLYLTIAVLEDGRFHEVLRRVPSTKAQDYPGAFKHNNWSIDSRGNVVLPKIKIPEEGVEAGMARIKGGEHNGINSQDREAEYSIVGRVSGFYVDCTEVTLREFKRVTTQVNTDARWKPVPPDWAITVNYDDALRFAENVGKRIPTELELAYVTELGEVEAGKQVEDQIDKFGPVGSLILDRFDFNFPVYGLRSNVAEWTTSLPTITTSTDNEAQLPMPFMRDHRIVCCGSRAAIGKEGLQVIAEKPVPLSVPIGRVSSGLGFRCVRSIRPRLTPQDFNDAVMKGRPLHVEVQ